MRNSARIDDMINRQCEEFCEQAGPQEPHVKFLCFLY